MVKSKYMWHLSASVVTPAVMLLKLPLLWQEKDGEFELSEERQ